MELESRERNAGHLARGWSRIKSFAKATEYKVVSFGKSLKKLGKDDPRRIIHSLKVGLALTLVSLLYYIRPLYDGYGVSGMWAVLTVVVAFEFTVGMSSLHLIMFVTLVVRSGSANDSNLYFFFLFRRDT